MLLLLMLLLFLLLLLGKTTRLIRLGMRFDTLRRNSEVSCLQIPQKPDIVFTNAVCNIILVPMYPQDRNYYLMRIVVSAFLLQ